MRSIAGAALICFVLANQLLFFLLHKHRAEFLFLFLNYCFVELIQMYYYY